MRDGRSERHVEGIDVVEKFRVRRALVAGFDGFAVEDLLYEYVLAGKAAGHRAFEAVVAPGGRDRRASSVDGDLEGMSLPSLAMPMRTNSSASALASIGTSLTIT